MKELFERDFSRNNADALAFKILEFLKTSKSTPKALYDAISDYAEKEKHYVLMMKLGLVEPENDKGLKILTEYKEIDKPSEYDNKLGKRIRKQTSALKGSL